MLFYFYLKQKYLSNVEYNRFKKSLMRRFMETAENLFKRQLSSPLDSHNLVLKYCQDVIVPKYENVLSCTFFQQSPLEGIDVEYYFKVMDTVSSKELNDLTTKVHDDFCDFCEKNRIPMDFARVYIIVNR